MTVSSSNAATVQTIENNEIKPGADSEIGASGASAQGNGIELVNSKDATISSNTVVRVGQNGIVVSGGKRNDVYLNTIRGAGDAGIVVNSSNNINIIENTVKNSGADGIDVLRQQ